MVSEVRGGNKARMSNNKTQIKECNPPQSLEDSLFFKRLSFNLSPEQKIFRDAIYSKENDIVFCNSKAGSGKTTIAVATACAMVEYGLYRNIIYCFSPVNFQYTVGLLPGTLEEKVAPFREPLAEALIECGFDPNITIKQLSSDINIKSGKAFVDCLPHTFLRGTNINSDTILIIDEAQNFFVDELKKVLTRVKGGKTIVIGHSEQCDLYKQTWMSGFVPYLNHFSSANRAVVCELTQNYRGWVSRWADELNIKKLKEEIKD